MSSQVRLVRSYNRTIASDLLRRYYEDSGFLNWGYWDTESKSQREASEALVDKLLDKIPDKGGRILDVACGLGASTRRLMRTYPPHMITGVNFSEVQIAEARKRAAGCTFRCMDAARLDFPDSWFDAVICVEAAFHFDTRDAFLREALRVLRPGGSLVLSDVLFRSSVASVLARIPRANHVASIAGYIGRLAAAGFEQIDVQDVTKACLSGFYRNILRWPTQERISGRMEFAESIVASLLCQIIAGYVRSVSKTALLASARKPGIRAG
jgi:ubiquinone/menaquinone biosynthesis C-methylase UbiE